MKRCLISLIFYLLGTSLFAQTRKIDSLKHRIKTAKDNPTRLKALLNLFDESDSLPEDTLWVYTLKAKVLAKQLENGHAYSLAALAQAEAYLRWNNPDKARALIESELIKYNVKDVASRSIYFKLAQTRFDCIGNNSNYRAAMPFLYDVMQKAEIYKDSAVIANCMNTLSAWDYDMDFLAEGRKWDYKAISYTVPGDPRFYVVLTSIYLTIGDNYRWINKLDSASWFINKAILLCHKTQNLTWTSNSLGRLAAIYIGKKKYLKAEQAILESLRIIKLVEGDAPQQEKLMFLAAVYEKSGKVNQAIKVLNDGLISEIKFNKYSTHSRKTPNKFDLAGVFYYQELAKCYRLKGDSKQYAATLEKIIDGKDAFYKANSAVAIAELETKYEVEKKVATIARQKLILTKDGYFFWGSVLFSFLGGSIIWLIFMAFKRKQKIKLQQLHDDEKRLSIQAVANAEESERKRIAADLHDNLGAQLSFIKRNVNFIIDQPDGFSKSDERKYLGYVNDIAQSAMIDLRETIWVLNKDVVDVQEFVDKLKSYLKQQLMDKDRIDWGFEDNIQQRWKLSAGEVMHLFRIVQELVNNIIKHAEANYINIEFNSDYTGSYQLTITDNGKGFDVNCKYKDHYGLENIQQRAKEINANIVIGSNAGVGTKIILSKEVNNAFELLNGHIANVNFTK
jgi:two-component system NarL family sensor kinase